MKEVINYSRIPHNYMLCLNRECPLADTCLRQMAEQCVPANIISWTVISPRYLSTLKGACPHYRSAAKVRYAKGFMRILENLPYKQMKVAIANLLNYFGQRTYYRVRKGERLLSPSEQKDVLNILKKCGVSSSQEFDAYVEQYYW